MYAYFKNFSKNLSHYFCFIIGVPTVQIDSCFNTKNLVDLINHGNIYQQWRFNTLINIHNPIFCSFLLVFPLFLQLKVKSYH